MLPFDIQVQIIERLPIKSLIRFRSLCKPWKSFIDCSEFIAGYKTQSQHLVINYEIGHGEEREVRYVSIVDDDVTFPQQKFALTVPPLVQVAIIVGSSHGLLCLTGYFGETQMAVLWNPAIRKSIAVALPNVVRRPFNSVLGFGVCPHTKDPKLVNITYIHGYRKIQSISCIPCQVMVFALSSREWTCLRSDQLPRKSIGFTWSQAVIGQFIYWFAYDRINVNGGSRNLIMSFDMTTQEFREVDLPDYLAEQPDSDSSLFRLRESLAVVEYGDVVERGTYLTWKRVCTVWMMEHGDSKAFTKLFTINAPNASVSRTLGFRKSGEPIVEMRDDNKDFYTPFALVVFEPCSEHIKDLGIHGNRYSSIASCYTESLLLLDYDEGHIVRCRAMKR